MCQGYPDIEHIIVDGCSTDDTMRVLERYAGRYNVRWISEPDRGQTHAINKGLRMATGEILTWLNSDDVLNPDAVQVVVNGFSQHPEADFLYGDYRIVDDRDRTLLEKKTVEFDRNVLVYGRSLIVQPASFFRRKVIDGLGLLDERYDFCMDIEFWVRALMHGLVFMRVDFPLAAQRLHRSTKTATVRWKLNEQHRAILNSYKLLPFRQSEFLNIGAFTALKYIYRSKASAKRAVKHRDFRLLSVVRLRRRIGENPKRDGS